MSRNLHEDLSHKAIENKTSNSGFGYTIGGFLLILAFIKLYYGHLTHATILLMIFGAAFVIIAAIIPVILTPLNKLWFLFGLLLFKVVNPIVLGLIYYVVVTPIGLAMQLFGGSSIQTKFDPQADTYWITRKPPGPNAESMNQQF